MSVLWCAGADRPRKIRNLLIIAFISTLVLSLLLPWLFESKVVAMTVLGLAMACWIAVLAIAEAALRISRGTKPPSVIGDGGGSPWAGSDNCWHCL